jgi:hypothetical protein
MKWLWLFLLLLNAVEAAADVYKCTAADGRTVYTQTPCDEASVPLDLRDTPASVIEGGLRDSEKQLLQGLEQEATPPSAVAAEPGEPPAAEQPYRAQCRGLNIVAFQPYSKTVFEPFQRDLLGGRIYHGASKIQCARVQLELPGYRGRLNISNTAEEIARRLYAQFADGSVAPGEEGSIAEGDNRFSSDKIYAGNFCFGLGRDPITNIDCR